MHVFFYFIFFFQEGVILQVSEVIVIDMERCLSGKQMCHLTFWNAHVVATQFEHGLNSNVTNLVTHF